MLFCSISMPRRYVCPRTIQLRNVEFNTLDVSITSMFPIVIDRNQGNVTAPLYSPCLIRDYTLTPMSICMLIQILPLELLILIQSMKHARWIGSMQ